MVLARRLINTSCLMLIRYQFTSSLTVDRYSQLNDVFDVQISCTIPDVGFDTMRKTIHQLIIRNN